MSPYNIFWQVQGEKEEKRYGTRKEQMREIKLDMGIGVLSGNLVAYAIILSTASTLFIHHQSITTERLTWLTIIFLLVTVCVMIAAAGLLFYGLLTGQGG
ncbi:MAG: divalent metal cation transporter [Ktedonobacteraceae bacterium]